MRQEKINKHGNKAVPSALYSEGRDWEGACRGLLGVLAIFYSWVWVFADTGVLTWRTFAQLLTYDLCGLLSVELDLS